MEVKLMMRYQTWKLDNKGELMWSRKPVTPTGNWKVVCTDGECVLHIGVEGKTAASKDVKVKGWFGRTVTKQEHYYIDCERFVPEEFLEVVTTSEGRCS